MTQSPSRPSPAAPSATPRRTPLSSMAQPSVMRPRTSLDRARARLSVLMPVYNEQATIETIVNYVHGAPIAPIQLELVVVDDCSTDGSREVLQRLQAEGRIHK